VPIPCGSPLLRFFTSFEESLQVATSPCCQQDLLDVILRVFPWLPGPLPRRSHRVHAPVNFPDVIGLPLGRLGRLPALVHDATSRGNDFEAADIPLCSGHQVCSPPRLLPPLWLCRRAAEAFYVRAERASLPPHAPDMLAVRTQAIDGARTCTLLDSQHCRLLPSQIVPTAAPYRRRAAEAFYVRAEHASLPPQASDMLTTRPGNGWCGDLHPTRFAALSAAPVQPRYFTSYAADHRHPADSCFVKCIARSSSSTTLEPSSTKQFRYVMPRPSGM